MASTLSNAEVRNLVRRLTDDDYNPGSGGSSPDVERDRMIDQIVALRRKLEDLSQLVVEMAARVIGT